MTEEGYDLQWSDHLRDVFSVLRSLRTNEAFSDVTIHCEGRNFFAHKVILAASSNFFERVLSGLPPEKSKILVMTDTRPELLRLLLDFIYNGETFVDARLLDEFMGTAEKLQIRGLRSTSPGGEEKSEAAPVSSSSASSSVTQETRELLKRRASTPTARLLPSPALTGPLAGSSRDGVGPKPNKRPRATPLPYDLKASSLPSSGFGVQPEVQSRSAGASRVSGDSLGMDHRNDVGGVSSVAIKTEKDDASLGHADDQADVGEWGEESSYGDEHYEEGEYDENYSEDAHGSHGEGAETLERPQNIPPEVSTDVVDSKSFFTVLKSQKGGDQIYCDGYFYNKDREHPRHVAWRCSKRLCRGRIFTSIDYHDQSTPPTLAGDHNHNPCPDKLKKKLQKMAEDAAFIGPYSEENEGL